MIKIVGLGPGAFEDLTLKSLDTMKRAKKLYLRTKIHPNVSKIEELGISFETFDYLYEKCQNFDEVYEKIAEVILSEEDVVYAVPGNPLVAEKSVVKIIEGAKLRGIELEIITAISFVDAVLNALKLDPIGGLKIIDGLELDSQSVDIKSGNIITQVYDKLVASEVKLKLFRYYDDNFLVYVVRAAGVPNMERVEKMPLYMIDRIDYVDYLTSLYIPPVNDRYDFNDLIQIMKRLRSTEGCPWDREQTHESLKRYLIEECYEVIDAIDKGDMELLKEELGDVFFQVIFHSQIAFENSEFSIADVINMVTEKMVKRHPHVFTEDHLNTSDEVLEIWEKNKRKEKNIKSYTESLKSIPQALPALLRSCKVQEKAKQVGFDWDNIDDAVSKLKEELNEFLEVYKSNNDGKIIEEMGDLIFSAVNVSRFLNINPEFALNSTTEKFIKRFQYIEKKATSMGKKIEEMTLKEMDELWNEAKTK